MINISAGNEFDINANYRIEVYNAEGKSIFINDQFLPFDAIHIDASSWNSGIYILKIDGESGEHFTQKILKR